MQTALGPKPGSKFGGLSSNSGLVDLSTGALLGGAALAAAIAAAASDSGNSAGTSTSTSTATATQ
jgi:hypothetical protein